MSLSEGVDLYTVEGVTALTRLYKGDSITMSNRSMPTTAISIMQDSSKLLLLLLFQNAIVIGVKIQL